jgi:hypothetical protein
MRYKSKSKTSKQNAPYICKAYFHLLTLNVFTRQQEKLEKKINAAGYKEKVPLEIQDKDTEKLSKLVQEMELFEKESERLEAVKSL